MTSSAGNGNAGAAGAPSFNSTVPKPHSLTATWVYIDSYRLLVGKRSSDGTLANPAGQFAVAHEPLGVALERVVRFHRVGVQPRDQRYVRACVHGVMMVGEYGADAFNNGKNAEDQASQASATTTLTTQITEHYSADGVDADHVVLGGAIYALSDEW